MIGLYVHLPFCLQKCPYCAFYSESGALEKGKAYIDRVLLEAESYPAEEVLSIYFGGGTPTALPAPLLVYLLEGLCARFPCRGEITLEANPATVSLADLSLLRRAGFNRLSLGIQSLQDTELRFLGRLHTASEAVSAVQAGAAAGFSNLSADLMFGVPGQTIPSVSDTLNKLLTLPVSHVSTYSLSIEDGTPFALNGISLPEEETERTMFYTIRDTLTANGFSHYEISNFARPGMEAVHNTNYWKCGEYIGLGAGAHGYYNNVRYENVADINAYLCTKQPRTEVATMTDDDKKTEYYMLGLRLREGVLETENQNLARLIELGLLERKAGRVRLTDRGLDIANYVIGELLI